MANDGLITSTVAKSAYDELQKLDNSLESVYQNILKINGIKGSTPSVLAGGSSQSVQQIQKLVQVREQSNKAIERERLAEIRLQQQREKAFDSYSKTQAKEAAALAKSETAYQRIQNSVNKLTKTYQDLAIRKELGNTLTKQEEAQLLSITNRLNMYQSALKKVDANIQKNQRNVGNYASGWNGLGNSINQITRELPAFTFSAQTGFLALSNNIPILTDEIGKLQRANKELIAQGLPVKSVFSQILSSLLSLQTAMGVGILLFTLYGDEISSFVSSLFSGSKAIDTMKESTEQLNKIRTDSQKSIVDERIALEANLAVARDTTLSLKEREIAAENVLKQYPFWFENLGKEAILNGNVAEAVRGVNEALLARAKANAAVSRITENQSLVIDAEEKIFEITEKRRKAEERLSAIRRRTYAASEQERGFQAEQDALADIASYNEDIADLRKEINAYNEINNRLTGYAIEQSKEAIGLDYQQANATELKTEKLVDYQATLFELQKKQLEGQAAYYKKTLENDENGFADREFAAQDYTKTVNALAQLQLDESIRLAQRETEERKSELRKQAKDGEISWTNANAVIASLEKDYLAQRALAYETFSQQVQSNTDEAANNLKGVFEGLSKQEQEAQLGKRTLDNLRQINLLLQGARGASTTKEFEKIDKAIKAIGETEADIADEQLRNQRASIEAEIERIGKLEKNKVNNAAINTLRAQQLEIDKQLEQSQQRRLKLIEYEKKQAASLRENYLKTFTDLGQFGLSSLNQFFDGTFKKLMEGTKLIEDAGERARAQFQLTSVAVLEVAQQVAAFTQQNQQATFDGYRRELDLQQQVAEGFAITEEAKAEVARQFEERRRELRRRELEAQKEQAIFNAVINTAQAVTAALPNFVLAGLVGALGAAQVALIASRDIPAYKEGTDFHRGGLAIVGDGGRSEIIKTPSGSLFRTPATDTLVDMPKGSAVYKSEADFLRNSGALNSNIGSDMPQLQQLTAEDIANGVSAGMSNLAILQSVWDETGIKKNMIKGNVNHIHHGNRVAMRGVVINKGRG